MSKDLRAQIRRALISKETEELLDIWQNGKADEWDEEAFEIAREIILERLGHVPLQSMVKQVEQILKNADEYLQTGELDKALSECERAIQIAPDLAFAHNQRGQVYDEMGQYENAIADYQAAVRLNPEFKEAWENLLSVEKDIEEVFLQSTTKEHLDQAREYAYNDEAEKAMEECALAQQAMPNIALAYNYLGMIMEELEQLEPAIEAYLKAIQLNPRFYAARENLGNARVRLEEEQYLQVALESPIETQEEDETEIEWDDSEVAEILEMDNPIPGWLYLDEKAFLLTGWPGHRTRQGRSGYDPLDTDFEDAHMEGVIFRKLITRRFRTRNPIYLLLMTFVGLIWCLPLLGIMAIIQGDWSLIFPSIIASPLLIGGIALLNNVIFSLILEEEPYEDEKRGYTFF